ncbi:MAG: hypothetical protein KGZ40_06020 [Clostridiales bacterium]|nr:hypothetical protein [Clostridiales bacterium]
MPDHSADEQRAFLDAYTEYIEFTLLPARDELLQIILPWQDPVYWESRVEPEKPLPTPIHRLRDRVKRPESVIDKIARKPADFPLGLKAESIETMTDTLGFRIVTHFLTDLARVDEAIRSTPELELATDDPPVAYLDEELAQRIGLSMKCEQKDSGYASVHYCLRVRPDASRLYEPPWVEVQVRTLTEDTWSEIEHQLGYKPNKQTSFAVSKQFDIIGAHLQAIDEHFQFLADELARFQEEREILDSDPLNAENLPRVLEKIGIRCGQSEIDPLLKALFSRSVVTVRDLRRIAGSHRVMERITRTHKHEIGRAPISFEIVTCLANLGGVSKPAKQIELIKAQIEANKVWQETLQKLRGAHGSAPSPNPGIDGSGDCDP